MKTVAWMSLLGAVGLSLGSGMPARAEQPVVVEVAPPVSDATITSTIMAKLESIKLLRNAQVTIETKNGVVTVWGSVPNGFALDQAREAIRSTPGVTRIDDQLRLDVRSPEAPSRN
ncbi:MAG TPA: BON domain-containing protein [Polyangia bacterium]|nr:BON domain-containing protein [Polyangia bacterium]